VFNINKTVHLKNVRLISHSDVVIIHVLLNQPIVKANVALMQLFALIKLVHQNIVIAKFQTDVQYLNPIVAKMVAALLWNMIFMATKDANQLLFVHHKDHFNALIKNV